METRKIFLLFTVFSLIVSPKIFSQDVKEQKSGYEALSSQLDKRRSPAWNADKRQTPLLTHTNTSDDDVNVLEVEHLIQALQAANKKFESKIYQNAEGGHSFDRIDTQTAQRIRVKIYKFLTQYLNPPHPITNVPELKKAAYRF